MAPAGAAGGEADADTVRFGFLFFFCVPTAKQKSGDEGGSFERDDEEEGSGRRALQDADSPNLSPGIRGQILQGAHVCSSFLFFPVCLVEFDGVIDSNRFIDADVLQAVLERVREFVC